MDDIFVTQPSLPDLDRYHDYLKQIWDSKWLTNNGQFHQKLETKLADYLKVPHLSLFSNGTLALITALKALNLKGEVITTPYSFVATAHSLIWNQIDPVFVDIDPITCNIDPSKIEAAITERTTGILPVHVYGNPSANKQISDIADKYGLALVYDAAHAFAVKENGESILNYGDLSVLSFHATKVFSTVEGGAIVSHSKEMKHHIDNLKNFGFRGETVVEEPGINAKMNELQATYGLLQLEQIDDLIYRRKEIADLYTKEFKNIDGIKTLQYKDNITYNYSYYPIFIDQKKSGISRDDLYSKLKDEGINCRRYFYPLITDFKPYNMNLKHDISNAKSIANEVLCLPIYPDLDMEKIVRIILEIKKYIL